MAAQTEPRPIGSRIAELLEEIDQSASWLAERSRMPRSTVTRIINGERQPTPETLAQLAPVLGVSVEQLVAETDAAHRVDEAASLIARRHYRDAIEKLIEAEREANNAKENARAFIEKLEAEEVRRQKAEARLETAERQRDDALRAAEQNARDARRYSDALACALADIARLKSNIGELGTQLTGSRRTNRVAAILAGAAAVASTATYFWTQDRDKGSQRKKRKADE